MESAFGKDCVQVCRHAAGGILSAASSKPSCYTWKQHISDDEEIIIYVFKMATQILIFSVWKKSLPCLERITEERDVSLNDLKVSMEQESLSVGYNCTLRQVYIAHAAVVHTTTLW